MSRWCSAFVLALAVGCGQSNQAPGTTAQSAPEPGRPAATTATAESEELLQVEDLGLERVSRDVVELRLTLVNTLGVPVRVGAQFAGSAGESGSVSGIVLSDPGGNKRYFVLRDQQNRPVCRSGLSSLAPGERVEASVRYPAPSETRVEVVAPGGRRLGSVSVPQAPEGTAGR